jgi:methyl acetate hydrolase
MASAQVDTDALRRIVQEATSTGPRPVPRIVVSVGNKDGVLFEEASGVKLFGEPASSPENKVSMDSIFWFASQTKLVTSLAAALLIENGAWTLDSLAEDFVPELKDVRILEGYDEETGKAKVRTPSTRITIRHLFTHTAGYASTYLSTVLEEASHASL